MTLPRSLTRLDYVLIIGVLALALMARIIPGPRTVDDAFITFRYSRNIVEGQGFVYNPNVRVLGTTTPLYTLLMAGISFVVGGQDFQTYALITNALIDVGTTLLLFLLARRLTGNRWIGALIGVLWAIAPRSVTFAIGGMETSLAVFWMIGCAWWLLVDQPIWLGIFAGLGLLTRIDAVIWIGPMFAYQLLEQWIKHKDKSILQRIPYRTWIAAVIPLIPWIIFSVLYFGSPLSNSVAAKTVAYVVPPWSALAEFIRVYSTPFFEFDSFGSIGAMVGSVAYLLLSLLGIHYALRRAPRLLPLLIYPWLYATIFSIANPLIFRWYSTPPIPGLMLSILAGAWSLFSLFKTHKALINTLMTASAILWIGMSLHAWTLHPDHAPDRPAPVMAWHLIELYYQQVGTTLHTNYGVGPTTRVASADIGTIGYFSRATIIDTVGLVTPALSAYYPVDPAIIISGQNYAIPPRLILDTAPDYLVTMEAFVRLGLEQNADFKASYGDPILKIPTGFYGTDMRVYKRTMP